ncbi:MAG: putative branched-chain amino acid transport ATP-binding protein [Ilumatobacteraceae bacterium]|nr:putative branched-chain amino acid transport ATP-binding protein [Ilumatobacteraceae bacterium]MCU1388265.1 putative branched-chain amino acid transport ATP-binding protein [Ilumatobacteraceae bacterium]
MTDLPAARLDVRGLVAGYEGAALVRGVDISVGPGEVVSLFGANGAGKTTTLAAIAGLIRPTAGTVHLDGQPLTRLPASEVVRRGLALVPEDRCLFSQLSVVENLRVAARRVGGDVDVAFARFPALEPLRRRAVGVLSGGEQQMVAIARALVMRPRVLLIDELSLGLAPMIVRDLLLAVRALADESDVAVLLVEQHVRLALDVIDRGYVLRQGSITVSGSAAQLRQQTDLLADSYLGTSVTA